MILYGNPTIPVFEEKKILAAGAMKAEAGAYTEAMFKADYPQFYDEDSAGFVPSAMFETFLAMANEAIAPSKWGTAWRLAVGLYVAHYCAMYLKTYSPSSASAAAAAGGAENTGLVKSAQMGDTSVSYDNSAIVAGTEKWGTWNATQYGSQLATMARSLGITGMYVV